MGENLDQLLGSKISLVSEKQIKYVGDLFSIDPDTSTIILKDVVCFGTEDRVSDPAAKQAKSDRVIPFVTFPGSQIVDLEVRHDLLLMSLHNSITDQLQFILSCR